MHCIHKYIFQFPVDWLKFQAISLIFGWDMVKTEGSYIQVAYKNVFGHISTNAWPFFMIQRPTIRGKCVWVGSNTLQDERPVATSLDRFSFGFWIFQQILQLATKKFQNLCNCNWWSGLLQLGSVRFRSFFQSSEPDLQTLLEGLSHNETVLTVCCLIWTPWQRKVFHRSLFVEFVPDALCCSWLDAKQPASFLDVCTSEDSSNKLIFCCLIMLDSWGLWKYHKL